jgi:hypothetical protein
MTGTAMTIHFAPLLPHLWLCMLTACAALLVLMSALFSRKGLPLRALCAGFFLLALLGPSLTVEKREAVRDVVALVADRSPSQHNGRRMERTDAALTALQKELAAYKDKLEVRIVEAPGAAEKLPRETKLFGAVDNALADVPEARRAGVILLTDGQIHDIPQSPAKAGGYGPVHALLSGERGESDRQFVIADAPAYGIVGQSVTVRYRIEDANTGETTASLIVRQDGREARAVRVPVNTDQTIELPIDHAGQNIAELEAAPLDGEITQANNRVPLVVNGVRDRLRVLLVSGQPHAGGRTWRNILTSDPGVDLVHFTILRVPDKLDATPQNELSLIAFPFHELFEVKLYDFDLIIFDRYKLNGILPDFYFANIARYVKEGGALLEASGPSFAGADSIYSTALRDVLPGYPTGEVFNEAFKPAVTDAGSRHPVTQGLSWPDGSGGANWGDWLRQVGVQPTHGDILMKGAHGEPLLILDHVGKGRVAQLASDQIWLWARGYQGGGPQAELLRRLAHWLMKEPELEENALDVKIEDATLVIRRRALDGRPMTVTVKTPGGTESRTELAAAADGVLEGRVPANELGIYTVNDGTQERYAIAGEVNPPELRGVRTTPDLIAPVAAASGGSVSWLADGVPSVRLENATRRYGGRGWIGLRRSNGYAVTGILDSPLLPAWLCALILAALMVGAWWREGKKS